MCDLPLQYIPRETLKSIVIITLYFELVSNFLKKKYIAIGN